MSKQDAAMGLIIIGGLALFFLWVYGLTEPNAPRIMRVISRVVTLTFYAALASFVVYCILILVM